MADGKQAWRASMELLIVAESVEEADRIWDVVTRLCSGSCVIVESGAMDAEPMAPQDVVPGSPLAKVLAG